MNDMEYARSGGAPGKKKKKVDMGALQSEFKRVLPALDIAVARDLLDCGFHHVDELRGRSPEVLFEQVRKLRPATPEEHLPSIRMMVYLSENPDADSKRLHPHLFV